MSHEPRQSVRKRVFRYLLKGTTDILFPNVCLCCARETLSPDRHICSFCLNEKFEYANPENRLSSSGILLPEGVAVQHALWRYDKGGDLQDLLHRLKYRHLAGIGYQTGQLLAKSLESHPVLHALVRGKNRLLVPVPLHFLQFYRRGYNQALFIAAGIQSEIKIPICNTGDIIRHKLTRSQTGFDLGERLRNVNNTFKVQRQPSFRDKIVFVVDDVFTTGATTFEISGELLSAGARKVVIVTVAQA